VITKVSEVVIAPSARIIVGSVGAMFTPSPKAKANVFEGNEDRATPRRRKPPKMREKRVFFACRIAVYM
jgi:hypothetical protein